MKYLDYSIRFLGKPPKPRPRLISQKAAAERHGIPAIQVKWAIDAGRIDYEFTAKYDRRMVVDNDRFKRWARNRKRTLANNFAESRKTEPKVLTIVG